MEHTTIYTRNKTTTTTTLYAHNLPAKSLWALNMSLWIAPESSYFLPSVRLCPLWIRLPHNRRVPYSPSWTLNFTNPYREDCIVKKKNPRLCNHTQTYQRPPPPFPIPPRTDIPASQAKRTKYIQSEEKTKRNFYTPEVAAVWRIPNDLSPPPTLLPVKHKQIHPKTIQTRNLPFLFLPNAAFWQRLAL